MNILLAGASGLVGQSLVSALKNHHQITVLGRDKTHLNKVFADTVQYLDWDELNACDANSFDLVYNLSGQSIGNKRWSPEVKANIISSRTQTNHKLIQWIIKYHAKPRYFCANAIGIYGLQQTGDLATYDEDSVIAYDKPRDFLQEVGVRWEQSLNPALDYGLKVTTTRFGVVLKKDEGFLKKLALSFKLGAGSVIGSGEQILSWIHHEDLTRAVQFLVNSDSSGAYNLSAPHPCTQAEFARAFAQALHRPLFLKTPAFVMNLLFGEMGESLINQGQRVYPKRLIDAGFHFNYPDILQALTHIY